MPDTNEKHLSGVTGRFQLEGADDIQATLRITMSLGTWKKVRAALEGDEYGVWQMKAMIRELIDTASTSAYARIEKNTASD